MAETGIQPLLQWQIRVPIFRNPVILRQLGIAVGIPFGLLASAIALLSGESIYALYALGLIAALLFVSWLLIMALYQGKYEAEFILDDRGALCRTQKKQARKNRAVNSLVTVLGLLSGRFSAAGAGMLAQSRQSEYLEWSRVKKASFHPKGRTILLCGGFAETVALFCTEENYPEIEEFVRRKTMR